MSHHQNSSFICERCHQHVRALTNGSYRNHCPACLWSKHLDNKPGDRASTCGGLMTPIGVVQHKKKGWQLVHRCTQCGHKQRNKIAQNCLEPDDFDLIIKLMVDTVP